MGAFIDTVPSATKTRAMADRVLQRLGRIQKQSDFEICRWLLCGFRLEVHRAHGYASFREYAHWVFGYSGRCTEERLRTAGALEHLPLISAAFEAGDLLYSVVREITRVATPATEREWLAAIDGKNAGQVERMVSGRGRGDGPTDPVDPDAERHRVLFKLRGAARALLSQARDVATRAGGGTHISDDDFITQMARAYLASATGAETIATDAGTTATDSETSATRWEPSDEAPGRESEPSVAELAATAVMENEPCGADPAAAAAHESRVAERAAAQPAVPAWETAEGRAPYQIALTICEECRAATQDAGGAQIPVDPLTVEMAQCDAQNIGRIDGTSYSRATQTIPPRIRRAVVRRHGGKCAVPGCRNRQCDVHHLDERCEGGTHHPERLIHLCDAHHRACHDGRLSIRGTWSGGFHFEHADGRPYGSPKTDGVQSKKLTDLHDILRAMGFRPKETRGLIDRIRPQVGVDTSTEDALKLALRHANVPGVREARGEYRPVHELERRVPTSPQVGVRCGDGATAPSLPLAAREADFPGAREARAAYRPVRDLERRVSRSPQVGVGADADGNPADRDPADRDHAGSTDGMLQFVLRQAS